MSHFGLPSSAGRMRQLGHPDWPLGPFGEAFDLELDYYLEHDFDSGCFVDLDYFDFDFRCRIRGRLHYFRGSFLDFRDHYLGHHHGQLPLVDWSLWTSQMAPRTTREWIP